MLCCFCFKIIMLYLVAKCKKMGNKQNVYVIIEVIWSQQIVNLLVRELQATRSLIKALGLEG